MNTFIILTFASLFSALEAAVSVVESTDACKSCRALSYVNSHLSKPFGSGSMAMLALAKKHSIEMSTRRRLFRPSMAEINARGALPCRTFLNSAFIGYTRSSCAKMWASKQHNKGIFSSTAIRKHLHAVVGEHRDVRSGVWCTVFFGVRTAFSDSGDCARVACQPIRFDTRMLSGINLYDLK